jgi:hypothetical protein
MRYLSNNTTSKSPMCSGPQLGGIEHLGMESNQYISILKINSEWVIS